MPNAFETPWVTLEVNDVPLSLCNDLGRPKLGMISWSSFFLPPPQPSQPGWESLQWKLVNSLHATTHLGEKALQRLLERSFRGTHFQTTVRQVVFFCPTCQLNNPQGTQRLQLAQPIQQRGAYQERTGRWVSPRRQFLKGINTY